jgi:hypothetical protein
VLAGSLTCRLAWWGPLQWDLVDQSQWIDVTAPHRWGFYTTHSDAPQSIRLLWTSGQLVAETSTWQHTILTTDIHAPGGIRTHDFSTLGRFNTGRVDHIKRWAYIKFCQRVWKSSIETAGILDGVWQTHYVLVQYLSPFLCMWQREMIGTFMVKNYWNMTNIVHSHT